MTGRHLGVLFGFGRYGCTAHITMEVLSRLNFKLAEASPEYVERRKVQAARFFAAAAASILSVRFAYKSTITRQFVPNVFQGNHQPPLGPNFTADAAVAVATGTVICGLVALMLVFGGCWVADVSRFSEFGWRMKSALGGGLKEQELAQMAMDDESRLIQDGLNDILEGKVEFDE